MTLNLSMKDAEDSLGGGPGSLAVEAFYVTGKYTPSNLNSLEIEAIIAVRQYKAKQDRERK